MNKKTVYLLLCIVFVVLSACYQIPSNQDKCITPSTTFSYDPVDHGNIPATQEPITPKSPWTIASSLPEPSLSILISRDIGGYSELWFIKTKKMDDALLAESLFEIVSYRTDSNIWGTIMTGKYKVFQPPFTSLFVQPDGSIWAYNFYPQSTLSEQPVVLSRFIEKEGRFEFEELTKAIPNGAIEPESQYPIRNQVILDHRGIFWIVVPHDHIYSYNPSTQEIKKHVAIPDIVPHYITLSANNSLYILQARSQDLIYPDRLFRFSQKDNSLQEIYVELELWPRASSILVDHSDRLWFGALGWMEPNGEWQQILRSSLFITDKVENGNYRWQDPKIVLESSNNLLWYNSGNGMVSLDPKKGEWCWFTTYQSNIVEDADHNLWMIADGKLFKYPLRP